MAKKPDLVEVERLDGVPIFLDRATAGTFEVTVQGRKHREKSLQKARERVLTSREPVGVIVLHGFNQGEKMRNGFRRTELYSYPGSPPFDDYYRHDDWLSESLEAFRQEYRDLERRFADFLSSEEVRARRVRPEDFPDGKVGQ